MGILTTISLRSHHHLLLPFPSTNFLLFAPGLPTPSGKTSILSVIKSMSKASASPAVLVCLAYFAVFCQLVPDLPFALKWETDHDY